MADAPVIRAARGTELRCRGWLQEAALRMLENNLDPDVAEDPANLVVYGGTGKAARTWDDYHRIVATLKRLENDETLLVQSGRPAAVFRTHAMAPRVLLANSNLVPDWATWDEFRRLEALGLTMYGQMTAGSWIYIGTQGIVQGTYETFAAIAEQRFGGSLAGRLVVTAGCGGMGGAQPLAVAMLDGVCLIADVDAHRLTRRVETRYLDLVAPDLDSALREVEEAKSSGEGRSIGLVMTANTLHSALRERGVVPDIVTDQTAAHDPLVGYVPDDLDLDQAAELRESDPAEYIRRARLAMARQVRDDGRVAGPRRDRRRLRQQPPHRGEDGRLRARVRLPGLRAGLRAAAVLPRHRAVPVGGAVRRSRRHRRHRRRDARAVSRQREAAALARRRAGSGSRSRGCRRGSAGSATATGTGRGCGSTSWCAPAR